MGSGCSRSAAGWQTYPDGYPASVPTATQSEVRQPDFRPTRVAGQTKALPPGLPLPGFPNHLAVCGPDACQKPSTKYKPAPAIPPMIGPTMGTQA